MATAAAAAVANCSQLPEPPSDLSGGSSPGVHSGFGALVGKIRNCFLRWLGAVTSPGTTRMSVWQRRRMDGGPRVKWVPMAPFVLACMYW
ncbi:hypothetical protein MRX96_003116 [Rhipicephalus microplus]